MREDLQHQQSRDAKRDALLAKASEQARRDGVTYRWQQETTRKLRWLHGLQFELTAWKGNPDAPRWIDSAREKSHREVRGLEQRLYRAGIEADTGCKLQKQWLADHAALIATVEGWKL